MIGEVCLWAKSVEILVFASRSFTTLKEACGTSKEVRVCDLRIGVNGLTPLHNMGAPKHH